MIRGSKPLPLTAALWRLSRAGTCRLAWKAAFSPTTALKGSIKYTATIATGARATDGSRLTVDYIWSFTTGSDSDTTAPTVITTNPADKAIYYYREGMAAPMGHFKNFKVEPRAVMVVDRSLREVEPGVYSTDVKLTRSGQFDVPFFLDQFKTSAKCLEGSEAATESLVEDVLVTPCLEIGIIATHVPQRILHPDPVVVIVKIP